MRHHLLKIAVAGMALALAAGCDPYDDDNRGYDEPERYGAVAISQAGPTCVQRGLGASWNVRSRRTAENNALARCLAETPPGIDCSVILSFDGSGTCWAYAEGQRHCGYGAATGVPLGLIKDEALFQCETRGGGNCILRGSGCNS